MLVKWGADGDHAPCRANVSSALQLGLFTESAGVSSVKTGVVRSEDFLL